MSKRIVYVAHPISGNIDENLADLARILRVINLTREGIVPLAPYYADVIALDDNSALERRRGIENTRELVEKMVFSELWLTGNCISFGMNEEIAMFVKLGIPVINFIKVF